MRRAQIVRFAIALAAEILCCAALNLFDDWTLEEMPVKFVAAAMLCGIAFLFAANEFPKVARASSLRPEEARQLEARAPLSLRWQAIIFWAVAIALRLVALPLEPGDDLWRYQWEGKIQRAGFNPYVHAPDDPNLEPVRAEFPEWHRINHRDFRAIYPPGAELLFGGLSRISDRPLFYKLLFAGADLGTIAVLLLLVGGTSRHANAAWYAWNPLVVYSFAGAAHFDSLMILPMTAGILFLTRFEAASDSRTKWRLALAASAAFGVAISMKLVPVLLLLTCVFALGLRAVTLVVSLGIPALLSTFYGWPKIHIWESLGRFAHVTRLNDLFWWLIEETVWPNPHQKNYHYNVILVICVVLVSLLFWRNWRRGMLWVFGIALVLTPVLHPWYCTWILPLAAWRRAYAWFVFSVTLFAYFLFWNERLFALPWHAEPRLRAIIMVPPLAAAISLGLARRTQRAQRNVTS
jgi:alpha-1,6-mannosyltransferase